MSGFGSQYIQLIVQKDGQMGYLTNSGSIHNSSNLYVMLNSDSQPRRFRICRRGIWSGPLPLHERVLDGGWTVLQKVRAARNRVRRRARA